MNNLTINPYKPNPIAFGNFFRPTPKINIESADKFVPNVLKMEISKAFNELHDIAVAKVSDYRNFKPVSIEFNNSDKNLFVNKVVLTIQKATDLTNPTHMTRRYLDIRIFDSNNATNVSQIVKKGTKEELLEALKDEKFVIEIQEFIKKSSSRLIDELL